MFCGTVQMLPPQTITPGMGNPYHSASTSFTNKGAQQADLINATATRGGSRRSYFRGKGNTRYLTRRRRFRGGNIVVPPIQGALFNGAGYNKMANSQAQSYVNSRAAGTNDNLVGQPGQTITHGGKRRKTRKNKRKHRKSRK